MAEAETSDELKEKGNAYFRAGQFQKAKEFYDQALLIDSSNPILYSNRALTLLKLEAYALAVNNANESIRLGHRRGHYRRGCAFLCQGRFEKALLDFRMAAKLMPKNTDVRRKLTFCDVEVRKRAFAKAIETPQSIPLSKRIDPSKITVEESYDGPVPTFPLGQKLVEEIKLYMSQQKLIHKRYVVEILKSVLAIFQQEKNIGQIDIPKNSSLFVCGDTHGQFYDLIKIFELNGLPSQRFLYLFNGDFVDRGSFSVECALLLFAYKIALPKHFFINRGNHESESMKNIYGFKNETIEKYDLEVYELFSEVFKWIPLGHVVGKKALVLHGGLFSKEGVTVEELNALERVCEPPDSGLLCELLWSDPEERTGRGPNKRGVGITFGADVLQRFLDLNGLEMLIRSHEVMDNGYQEIFGGKLVTVFSAPNYCDSMCNKGAVVKIDSEYNHEFIVFEASPHPNVKAMKYSVGTAV